VVAGFNNGPLVVGVGVIAVADRSESVGLNCSTAWPLVRERLVIDATPPQPSLRGAQLCLRDWCWSW